MIINFQKVQPSRTSGSIRRFSYYHSTLLSTTSLQRCLMVRGVGECLELPSSSEKSQQVRQALYQLAVAPM